MDYIAAPSVRSYAGRQGVDLEAVAAATGRRHLAREDIDQYLSRLDGNDQATDQPRTSDRRHWEADHSEFGQVVQEPVSRMAQIAAENLAAANAQIPQVTHHDRADVRRIDAIRAHLKNEAIDRGIKLTALAFHIKALASCLKAFPKFNSSLSHDGLTLYLKSYFHIGIAVDTTAGLMVPVIRDVDKKGLWQIASDIADVAMRAQARKIRPDEMGGASMSVSNLGGIGGTAFTPIVNPPEVAILGITRTEVVPVWKDDIFVPVTMVPLDLSYDHRVINGAEAARFLKHFSGLIEDPRRMLI